jgi:PAS domain S-box-containing protein
MTATADIPVVEDVRIMREALPGAVQMRLEMTKPLSAIQSYGLAFLSVSAALAGALLLQRYNFTGVEFTVFLIAIVITVWYGRLQAAIFALVLACLVFNYFFTEPLHTLYVTRSELPYYFIFVFFASLLTSFTAVRRRVERDLLQSRDELKREINERNERSSLLDLTHDSICVRDMNDVITFWNRGAEELYGYTAGEVVGRVTTHRLLQTVFPTPLDDMNAELLSTGRWAGELEHIKADGSGVVVASRWALRRDEHGEPIAILETNNDITERNRREREIRMLNEELGKRAAELEAINKELEAFAYSISHDLRAPLRHMVGFTELLKKSAASLLDDKSHRYVAIILEAAKRMGNLIDDLLAFSRIGRAQTRKAMVSLQQLVQEAMAEAEQDTGRRNIVWTVGALPAWYGDRSMLRLALVNLVSNAVKFTRTRAQAEIEIACMDQNQDQVVMFIRDNGVGFDMKYVDKLFGVFQRLHTPEAFEGTGIGLATVQRIVHRHGGRVWAEGVVDKGATFYFSLSKRQESDQ